MAVIKRGSIAAPTVPKETIEAPALGGEVVVRGLLLSERLALQHRLASLRKTGAPDQADVQIILPLLLSQCVLDADGLSVFSQDDWQAFGSRHADQAITLFAAAWRLSGFDLDETTKN